jgi:hypothetical protein
MTLESRDHCLQSILHDELQSVDRGAKPDRQAILDAPPDLRDGLAHQPRRGPGDGNLVDQPNVRVLIAVPRGEPDGLFHLGRGGIGFPLRVCRRGRQPR